jgi:hypothetical protein
LPWILYAIIAPSPRMTMLASGRTRSLSLQKRPRKRSRASERRQLAKRPVEYLARAGFVVMQKPAIGGRAASGRGRHTRKRATAAPFLLEVNRTRWPVCLSAASLRGCSDSFTVLIARSRLRIIRSVVLWEANNCIGGKKRPIGEDRLHDLKSVRDPIDAAEQRLLVHSRDRRGRQTRSPARCAAPPSRV